MPNNLKDNKGPMCFYAMRYKRLEAKDFPVMPIKVKINKSS